MHWLRDSQWRRYILSHRDNFWRAFCCYFCMVGSLGWSLASVCGCQRCKCYSSQEGFILENVSSPKYQHFCYWETIIQIIFYINFAFGLEISVQWTMKKVERKEMILWSGIKQTIKLEWVGYFSSWKYPDGDDQRHSHILEVIFPSALHWFLFQASTQCLHSSVQFESWKICQPWIRGAFLLKQWIKGREFIPRLSVSWRMWVQLSMSDGTSSFRE